MINLEKDTERVLSSFDKRIEEIGEMIIDLKNDVLNQHPALEEGIPLELASLIDSYLIQTIVNKVRQSI
jgi:hypothetical protein